MIYYPIIAVIFYLYFQSQYNYAKLYLEQIAPNKTPEQIEQVLVYGTALLAILWPLTIGYAIYEAYKK